MNNISTINNTIPDKACSDAIRKEINLFCDRLTEQLPAYFKLHSRLLGVADPIKHDINCSINELAKVLNCGHYALLGVLICLSNIKFIDFPKHDIKDFDKDIRIKILVRY